jgi:hypothetical protein
MLHQTFRSFFKNATCCYYYSYNPLSGINIKIAKKISYEIILDAMFIYIILIFNQNSTSQLSFGQFIEVPIIIRKESL